MKVFNERYNLNGIKKYNQQSPLTVENANKYAEGVLLLNKRIQNTLNDDNKIVNTNEDLYNEYVDTAKNFNKRVKMIMRENINKSSTSTRYETDAERDKRIMKLGKETEKIDKRKQAKAKYKGAPVSSKYSVGSGLQKGHGLKKYQNYLKDMKNNGFNTKEARELYNAIYKPNIKAIRKGGLILEEMDLDLNNMENWLMVLMSDGVKLNGGADEDYYMSGDKQYKKHQRKNIFNRASYDLKNNPIKTRTIKEIITDDVPSIEKVPTYIKPLNNDPYDGVDVEDLSDPDAWGATFKNIGNLIATGLKPFIPFLSLF